MKLMAYTVGWSLLKFQKMNQIQYIKYFMVASLALMITNRILGLNKQRINLAYCMIAHDQSYKF